MLASPPYRSLFRTKSETPTAESGIDRALFGGGTIRRWVVEPHAPFVCRLIPGVERRMLICNCSVLT